MSHIKCSWYLFFDMREKVWKGISLLSTQPHNSRSNSEKKTSLNITQHLYGFDINWDWTQNPKESQHSICGVNVSTAPPRYHGSHQILTLKMHRARAHLFILPILWVSLACFCLLVFAILSHENVHRFEIILGRQSIIFFPLKTHVTQNWFNPGTKKEEKKREKKLPIATNYKKYKEK